MKKHTALCLIPIIVSVTLLAQAGEFAALKKKLVDARFSLYVMLDDAGKRDERQQKLVKDTADAVSVMLAAMKAPAGKEARFKELVETWEAFNATRKEDLVPLILAKKQKEAEKLAGGVQKERFKRMMDLCDELEK